MPDSVGLKLGSLAPHQTEEGAEDERHSARHAHHLRGDGVDFATTTAVGIEHAGPVVGDA